MINLRKFFLGQYLALFAMAMMFIGPALSTTFVDDSSEVICTSTGIKVIASDGIFENHKDLQDLNNFAPLRTKEVSSISSNSFAVLQFYFQKFAYFSIVYQR